MSSKFIAWVLIIVGSVLLLNQLDLFYLNRANLIIMFSAAIGFILLKKGIDHPQRKGILGGTFFTGISLTLVAMKYSYFPMTDSFGLGIILMNLALANLVYFVLLPQKTFNLIVGLIFAAIGSPFLLFHYEFLSRWELGNMISTYWPTLLILIGIGFLVDALIKRNRNNQNFLQS